MKDAERALIAASTGEAAIFRGRVAEDNGTLRLRGFMNMSARSLRFQLSDRPAGCILNGVLQPTLSLKIYRGVVLVMFCLFTVMTTVNVIRGHASLLFSFEMLIGEFLFFVLFINGYTWLTVLFTRRIERTLLKSIEYVLRDDASAAVAADLLSSSR